MTDGGLTDRTLRIQLLLAGALVTIAGLGIFDLVLDAPGSRTGLHSLVEFTLIAVCLACAAYFALSWRRSERWRVGAERSLAGARAALVADRAEGDAWRRRAQALLRGLAEAIDTQLTAWELTPAERETAFLLLKGFSHKEIAAISKRSERTVRQHAVSVYRKSGLSGRAGLSAFFLEDLLVPAGGSRDEPAHGPPGGRDRPDTGSQVRGAGETVAQR